MNTKSYSACLYLLIVSLGPCAEAQSRAHDNVSVSGQLETDRLSAADFVVVLSSGGEMERRANVGVGGDFEFVDVPTGHYELTVTTLYGAVVHRQYVSLHSPAEHISVRLPEQKNVEHPTSRTVSAARLRHKVPSKARKEFEKGVEAARKKDSASAIGHLARATELDPEFMEAHNNLGIQHLKADAYETALGYFQKAAELDPGAPSPHINLAMALVRLERYSEAEQVARKATRLAGDNAVARYTLGFVLLKQEKNTSEALDNLQRACDRIPSARLAIAEMSEKRGDVERAKEELRAYLKAAKPEERQTAETWLAELQ